MRPVVDSEASTHRATEERLQAGDATEGAGPVDGQGHATLGADGGLVALEEVRVAVGGFYDDAAPVEQLRGRGERADEGLAVADGGGDDNALAHRVSGCWPTKGPLA